MIVDLGIRKAVTGKGVRGNVGGRAVALGNTAMMQDMGLDTTQAEEKANSLRAMGRTAMFVAVDGALAGIVAVADPIKDRGGPEIWTSLQLS